MGRSRFRSTCAETARWRRKLLLPRPTTLAFVSPANPHGLNASRVLGGFDVGVLSRDGALPWPVQSVLTPVLDDGDAPMHEAWLTDAVVEHGEADDLAWRRSAELLFGVVTMAEADVPASDGASALCVLGERAYARIFRLLDAMGVPHLWRVWNYIPDINGEQAGLERYQQFNRGCGTAFERCARSVTEQVPAACALGVSGSPLSIAFLAGCSPLRSVENPRQVSAHHYPHVCGPRSPTFSRAALADVGSQEWLFVSGTASIVGHESRHLGDVVAQTLESMDSVAAVVAEAARHSRSGGFPLDTLHYRVYLRDAADAQAVRTAVTGRVGQAEVLCVQADVCRRELLVEIEALGSQSC